jgi:putative transposase
MDLDRAFVNFFEGRAKYPNFKKLGRGDPGLRWPQGVEVNGRCVWLPKLGWVKARFSRKMAGAIKSASMNFDGLHWHASILVEEDVEAPAKHEGPHLGVDAGVVESLAFSDGRRFRLPVATLEEERRLVLLSRRASRCQAGSGRHHRAKRKLLIFSRKIINRVNDARHKQTTILAKKPRPDIRRSLGAWLAHPLRPGNGRNPRTQCGGKGGAQPRHAGTGTC